MYSLHLGFGSRVFRYYLEFPSPQSVCLITAKDRDLFLCKGACHANHSQHVSGYGNNHL